MMDKIESKYSFFALFAFLISIGIGGFIGTISLWAIIKDINEGNPIEKVLIFSAIVFSSLLIYSIYRFLKDSPPFIIDKNGLRFKNLLRTRVYLWKEVKKMDLVTKYNYSFLF